MSEKRKNLVPEWGPPEVMEDVVQGEPEWFELRRGIPTASHFSAVVRNADAETRKKYMHFLAGEVLSGRVGESKTFPAMDRGKEMEPRAREAYERRNVVSVKQVGFVRRKLPSGRYVGASPDGLIGKRKGLEIKTLAPHLMVPILDRGAGGVTGEHRWQCYGTILVADLDEVDLTLYYDGMPVQPQYSIQRNEQDLVELANAIEVFDHELHKRVGRIRKMG